ncbi:MAG TPA: hypothetical protein DCQ97_08445 [Chitinophagaceae bacterium]|nr:hypothetical protein [Chitinophagaceae bacterium]
MLCACLISCTASKTIQQQSSCLVKQSLSGYTRISNTDYLIETKQLGRTYLNFVIDSCRRISNTEVNMLGYVSFSDVSIGHERKMPDADIIQATQTDRKSVKYSRYLGKTDQSGKFNIRVDVQKKEVYLLLDKQNFTYTSVQLTF